MVNRICRVFRWKTTRAIIALAIIGGFVALAPHMVKSKPPRDIPVYNFPQQTVSSRLPEIEATSFYGVSLTPIAKQGKSGVEGVRNIDRNTYRLHVGGLVDNELSLSYDELCSLPAYADLAYMPCAGGWGFTAKWTGFRVIDLLNRAGLKEGAAWVVFKSDGGYITALPLDYIKDSYVIMAYGLNDTTLCADRGFPFQLVAKNKLGYKWAKWVTEIEVTDREVKGYWESKGYSGSGDIVK